VIQPATAALQQRQSEKQRHERAIASRDRQQRQAVRDLRCAHPGEHADHQRALIAEIESGDQFGAAVG
jgi:hypothetical protein